ncbi:MAG: PQQ-like beta-propeller repeat protein [Pirellulaceae bacterium]|nr:PQQ-like beta-propeller repeat protein [Pirellulaceae bacterium]
MKWFARLVACLNLMCVGSVLADSWPQAAGPHYNFRVSGEAPTHWSVVRNENIAWRTPMPECGQAAVTIWGEKVFTAIHQPIKSFDERFAGGEIVGYCLDADSGDVLWTVDLPGTQTMEMACGFSDATVFAPIADDQHVWFFNRCGSMGCYTHDGQEVWLRKYKMRFRHSARMCEPMLVNGQILNVEVDDKEMGYRINKFQPGTSITQKPVIPPEVTDEKTVWTYLHGIDAATGKILWRENAGTSIHNTPLVNRLADGTPAVVHARGGGHGPLEKPYGLSLTSLAPGSEGKTLWSTSLPKLDPPFQNHFDAEHVFAFHDRDHIVLDTTTGKVIRRDPLDESATLYRRNQQSDRWERQENARVKLNKGHPNTNQANIVVGDWHWFLAHDAHYVGRVHTRTGKVEYLEVPAQLVVSDVDRDQDVWLWGKGKPDNRPTNAAGFPIGRKGHDTSGWGHISAASPILVGKFLYWPVVTGTVYVLDTTVRELTPDALVAVNDLGVSGRTWTLASFSYARGRLYMHTMREVICIE